MDRPLVILHGEITTPPFSSETRRWAGFLLRKLQQGHTLTMPDSRPMPSIGPRCHELRIQDVQKRITWRILYRIDHDAVLIGDIFVKKAQKTPTEAIERCRSRLARFDENRRQR